MAVQSPERQMLDDATFEQGVPHEYFATQRAGDPVRWIDSGDDAGFWSVTGYREVVAVTRDFRTFSSQLGGTTLEDISPEDLQARKTLIDTDPPQHTAMRRLLATHLTPNRVHKEWLGFVDALVTETLDDVLQQERFEYVSTVASVVPIKVLGELLGVPESDQHYLMKLGDEMIAGADPDHAPRVAASPELVAESSGYPFSSPAGRELWQYADGLRRRREGDIGHDVFSLLMTGTIDGRKLTSRELDNYFSLLVIAGNETTRMALSHGVIAFAEHPEQYAAFRADPEGLLNQAMEEILRWSTPIHHFRRTATSESELGGKAIAAGDKVIMWYASANRDESVFHDPFTFDITRAPNPHLAFGGGGPHVCLGNSLARLELRIVFRELARRVATIELDGPVRRLRSNLTHGIKELPVRFTYA